MVLLTCLGSKFDATVVHHVVSRRLWGGDVEELLLPVNLGVLSIQGQLCGRKFRVG